MRAIVMVFVGLAGCARLGFDSAVVSDGSAPDAAGDSAARDSSGDHATESSVADTSAVGLDGQVPPAVLCDWSSGPKVQSVEALATLNSNTTDADPFLVVDGLTLYFSSIRSGNFDIFSATRTTLSDPFGNPQPVADLNTSAAEARVEIVASGKTAYLNTDRSGGPGKHDIWVGTRSSTSGPFAAWKPLENVNSANNEYDHHITADGLSLWFTSSGRADSVGGQDIFVATRANTADAFQSPKALQGISTTDSESNPSLTADQLTLVFTRCAGAGCDLYYATRSGPTAPFGPAQPVPEVTTGAYEGESFVRSDGCELFFIRDISGSHWDLFRAALTP